MSSQQCVVVRVVVLLVLASGGGLKLSAQQLRSRDVDTCGAYVVLDRWDETVGHGRKARRYRVRKFRDIATSQTRTVYFDQAGFAVNLKQVKVNVAPEDKISQRLLDLWKQD